MARNPIVYVYGSKASNKTYPSQQETIENGIIYQSEIISSNLNGISNKIFSAMREAQVMGGFYDNNQIYNKNDFVCQLVQEEGGVVKILYFCCKQDSTTQKPPLSGNSSSNFNDVNILTWDSNIKENTDYWGRVEYKNLSIEKQSLSSNFSYILVPNTYQNNCVGTLKVKLKSNSTTGYDCCFELVFLGTINDFKIKNVLYSSKVRSEESSVTVETSIGFPGFFLEIDSEYLKLSVNNNKYCETMECDYSEMNFSYTPSESSYSITKPYAIREGGGTYIADLGDIKQNLRNATAPSGDSYEFYLFSRGCVQWTQSMVLNTIYYHQWNNGGMPSVSISVDDCVIANKGTNNLNDNGKIFTPQLPNIKGTFKVSGGNGGLDGLSGCVVSNGRHIQAVSYSSSGFGDSVMIDASRSNSIYQNGGTVRMKTLVATFLLQAF